MSVSAVGSSSNAYVSALQQQSSTSAVQAVGRERENDGDKDDGVATAKAPTPSANPQRQSERPNHRHNHQHVCLSSPRTRPFLSITDGLLDLPCRRAHHDAGTRNQGDGNSRLAPENLG